MTNNTSTPEDPTTEPTCSGCGRTDADLPLTAFPGGWGLPRRYYHMGERAYVCSTHPGFDRERALRETWGWRGSPWPTKTNVVQLGFGITFLESARPVYYETLAEAIVATLELEFDAVTVDALRDLITDTWPPLVDLWYPGVPWLPEDSTTAFCVIGPQQRMQGVM